MENNKNFDDFLGFLRKYKGAVIGGLIAIIIACTGLWKLLIAVAVIIAGFWIGNYVQKNKEKVNEMDYFIYFCKVKNEYT